MTARKKEVKDAAVAPGKRRGPTHTAVHDWVLYSKVSPAAKALYAVLRSHVNGDRADDLTWTSSNALALILGYSRGDKIKKFEDELVELGAVSIEKRGMPAKKFYTVEQFPPVGYPGPVSSAHWYDQNGLEVDKLRQAERVVREERRVRAREAKASDAEVTNLGPVAPPISGGQAAPDSGGHVPPEEGGHAPPDQGREPSLGLSVGSSLDLRTSPSIADQSAETEEEKETRISPKFQDQEEETIESVKWPLVMPTLDEWETALLEECLRSAPASWTRNGVLKVIGSRRIRELIARDPELVRRAFLISAKSRGKVNLPIRMWHVDGCPHWRTAERQLAAERAPKPDAGVGVEGASEAIQLVAAPSQLQESPDEPQEMFEDGAAARAAARALLAERKATRAAQAPAPRTPEQALAELDRAIGVGA